MFPYVGLVADALLLSDASFSDSFPEPCPTPEYSDPRQGSAAFRVSHASQLFAECVDVSWLDPARMAQIGRASCRERV